jgi:uncharacterized membrane protein YjjB (DUF3815 family)
MQVFIFTCLAAFIACIGFSVLYQIRGKKIIVASLCGFVAWAAYLIIFYFTKSEVISYFTAGAAVALYAETAAFIFKNPATLFLATGIIPTVPGLTIYKTMQACLFGDVNKFLACGIQTVKISLAIALGLILVSSLWKLVRTMYARFGKTKKSAA